MLVSPDAACLNLGSFLSLAIGSTEKSASDIGNTWLSGLCASGSCPNSTIVSVVQNFTTGCAEDLNNLSLGSIGVNDQTILDYALAYYPTVRQIACLEDDATNQLCVPETISALESVVGPLGVADVQWDKLWKDIQTLITADYKSLVCTGCVKEAYNIAAKVFPFPDLLTQASQPITDTCGASFIDGNSVDGISQTALTGVFVAKTQSSVVAFRPRGFSLTMTVAISSAWFFFA
ncbi:hypothetical protein GALMADRAFT_248456 [Galerina marginata CBS 339.88]|uniref:Uncharacterized protein n=1 Tax=Galerina marginata (strain CBS 339.88) TaxID=685588 RepID=A0A067SXT7_GALM3|nr:hypothetical protein GALMADRAFT_248456 [Galerina marginata CBS 339.88]